MLRIMQMDFSFDPWGQCQLNEIPTKETATANPSVQASIQRMVT